MTLDIGLLPGWLSVVIWLCSVIALAAALRYAPWGRLREPRWQHLCGGAVVALLLLWSLRAGITPGLEIHFLGVTALTLMFGWSTALLVLALVSVGLGLAGFQYWPNLGLLYLVYAVVPASVNYGLLCGAERYLPRHLFVYLFVVAFAGAMLAIIAMSLTLSAVVVGAGLYRFEQVAYEYLSFLPLLAMAEALLNGMVMTGMVILRPDWVSTYDEARYLGPKS